MILLSMVVAFVSFYTPKITLFLLQNGDKKISLEEFHNMADMKKQKE